MPMGKGTYGSQVGRPEKKKLKAKGRKISWVFGGVKYYGNVIRETKNKIFARTHNNKVKVINKEKK